MLFIDVMSIPFATEACREGTPNTGIKMVEAIMTIVKAITITDCFPFFFMYQVATATPNKPPMVETKAMKRL